MGVTHLDSLQAASKEILKLKQKGSINLVVFKLKQQSFVGYGIDAFQKVKKKLYLLVLMSLSGKEKPLIFLFSTFSGVNAQQVPAVRSQDSRFQNKSVTLDRP